MIENIKLLRNCIVSERRYIEEKHLLRNENNVMILLLQNRLVAINKDIEQHKRIIRNYRDDLGRTSDLSRARNRLMAINN